MKTNMSSRTSEDPETEKRGVTTELALTGSRTRVTCLEGKYPNRWTINARAALSAALNNITLYRRHLLILVVHLSEHI